MSTYSLISNQVLGSSTASVTFSSIPGTYTDLILRISVRDTGSPATNGILQLTFNGSSATNYSYTGIYSTGSTTKSSQGGGTMAYIYISPGWTTTNANSANAFSSMDIYIPSYANSSNKSTYWAIATPDSGGTTSLTASAAGLWRGTSAITSLTLTSTNLNVANSSFSLYGISNA